MEDALDLAGQSGDGLAAAVAADALELSAATVRLAHPLLGSVLYSGLEPSGRRALHSRLSRLPLDPDEHAHHVALAAAGPDAKAAAQAEATAAVASRRGAPETAAELLELSLALTPAADGAGRLRRTDSLAMAHFLSGDAARAVRHWEDLMEAAAAGPVRAHAVWRLVEFGSATRPGGFEDGPEMLAAVLPEALTEPSLQSDIEATLAEHILWGRGPLEAAPHAEAALALGDQDGGRTLAHALSCLAVTDFFLAGGRADGLLARAEGLEVDVAPVQVEVTPAAYRAYLMAFAGDALGDAGARLDALIEDAMRRGDEPSLPFLLWQRCEVAVGLGQLELAASLATRCREAVDSSGRSGRLGAALYCQALVAAHRGAAEEAIELAEAALRVDEPRGVGYLIGLYRWLLGFAELSLGRHERALGRIEPAHRLLAEQGYSEPSLYRFVPDEVEALVGLGRISEAESVLAPYETAARRLGRRSALAAAARSRGLLLAALGQAGAADAELERAVDQERQLGRRFHEGRAELARAETARRGRHKAVAREAAGRALQLFQDIGAELFAARAREQVNRIEARHRAAFELTPTERRIAELLASGHSNSEIAGRLFMSRKTVERHLSNAYQRLGLRTRAELAALVGTGDPARSPR